MTAAGRRREELELRGEGGNLRLLVPSRFRGVKMASGAKDLLSRAGALMKGAGLIVDLRGEGWSRSDIISVIDEIISPAEAEVIAWTAEDPEAVSWMKRAGFSINSPVERGKPCRGVPEEVPRSRLVEESLRSGRKIEHGGDIIVLGNVNDGAEMIAGGSVVVLGRLRGLAHAGLDREDDVFIVAGQFEASQVRIGGKISYIDETCSWWGKPVSMRVRGGSIVVREIRDKGV
ncbi:MAG: septum site-determining protein MinC [Thermovirgaceae bacterium]|nr:septum site-determining protein MinC [Thermovirgaceae bacterium]